MFSLFSAAYTGARRAGVLDTRAGSALFIGAYFAYKKHLEDPFDKLIRRQPELFRGGHLVDAGANIGYCSSLFSEIADPGCRVFAFEPEAFNFGLLQRVVRRRGNVVATQAALGASSGTIGLLLNPRHHGDHRVCEGKSADTHVPLVQLDAFLAERRAQAPVSLIKIDVQGYELAVCQGAEQTLARNARCAVVMEYMPEALRDLGVAPADLLQWFAARGYRMDTVNADGTTTEGFSGVVPLRGYVDLLFRRCT